MCQLLGMTCNVPTDICFSFRGFSARGGGTDVHADGFGVAFFEGRGCRAFLDPQPARDSRVTELVRRVPIRSTAVVAHVRMATQGAVALENCHPFQRELWGRHWAFAHNGNQVVLPPASGGFYRPVGATDGERAFCLLLEDLRARFPQDLVDEDLTVDFAHHTGPEDRVAVIATAPLSDNEAWAEPPRGEVAVFEGGRLLPPS